MKMALWPAVALVGLTHAVMAQAGDVAGKCGLKRLASVHFTVIDHRLYLPITAASRGAWVLLDTKAIVGTIQKQYVHDFAHGTYTRPPYPTPLAHVEPFQLGLMKFERVDLAVVPEFRGVPVPAGTDPLIGSLAMDAFAHVDFELDFKTSRINFYSQDHCPGSVVYWASSYASIPMQLSPEGVYYFPVELDGQRIEATLQTSWGPSILFTDVSRGLFGFDENSPDVEHKPDDTGKALAHYRAMSLTTEGLKVINADIVLSPNPIRGHCSFGKSPEADGAVRYLGCGSFVAPLRIGLQVLEQLHLYFATKERVLYFTRADADPADVPGVRIEPAGSN
jgi:hypothetical protein